VRSIDQTDLDDVDLGQWRDDLRVVQEEDGTEPVPPKLLAAMKARVMPETVAVIHVGGQRQQREILTIHIVL
jgi:hypothetical protein